MLTPNNLWAAWTLQPSLLIGLALTLILYAAGVRQVWMRAGIGRGIGIRRCIYFAGALAALVVALVSPLDALSEALFAAHMVQHLVLILIAAPLLVMSDLPPALLWALPRAEARAISRLSHSAPITRGWRVLSHPAVAWLVFALALWVWHAPLLFEAALHDTSIHAIEHLVLLAASMLFWWLLLKPGGPEHVRYGIAVPYLFTTAVHSGVLGALMTFSAQAWYAFYTPTVAAWGYTPLEDQQLAGLVMWIPGGAVFSVLAIVYFAAWFNALEKRSMRDA